MPSTPGVRSIDGCNCHECRSRTSIFARREERDVRDATVGSHQNFAEGCRSVEGLGHLACFQVDRENVTLQAGRDQPPAIGCGLGTIDGLWKIDPP